MLSTNYEAVRARNRRETRTEEVRAYHREWAQANRDKVRSYEAKVDPDIRREKGRIRMAAWRQANPEKAKALSPASQVRRNKYLEQYRKDHPHNHKIWKLANPDKVLANHNKRRARKIAAGGSGVSPSQWREVLDVFGRRCAYCGQLAKLQMEHVEPLSKGGVHDIDNVVPACGPCNFSKHNSQILTWLVRRALT